MATLGARVSDEFYDKVSKAASLAGLKVSKFIEEAVSYRVTHGPPQDPDQKVMDFRKAPGDTSKNREIVHDLLLAEGPATKFELAAKLKWDEHWVSPRLTELKRDGKIIMSGTKINPNSGKPCHVWQAKKEVNLDG
jgi:hypothetical protein